MLIAGVFLFFFLRLLRHSSLLNIFYMREYLISYKSGTLTQNLFNSPKSSTSLGVCVFLMVNLLGKGEFEKFVGVQVLSFHFLDLLL